MKLLLLFIALVMGERIQNYNQAGKSFVQQYYAMFDSSQRMNLRNFYENNDSILVASGNIFIGVDAIVLKLTSMVTIMQRNITASDCQPTNDAGIIVNVAGKFSFIDASKTVSTNATNATLWFNEMFVLKPRVTSFFIENQHFRTSVWNMTTASMNSSDGLIFV